jgi:hypothetical protein
LNEWVLKTNLRTKFSAHNCIVLSFSSHASLILKVVFANGFKHIGDKPQRLPYKLQLIYFRRAMHLQGYVFFKVSFCSSTLPINKLFDNNLFEKTYLTLECKMLRNNLWCLVSRYVKIERHAYKNTTLIMTKEKDKIIN